MRLDAPFGLLLALSLFGTTGCKNECQEICVRMVDFAEECGFTVDEGDLDECIDAQAESSKEDRQVCKDYNAAETIRNEWTCEELQLYFDGDEPPE